MGRNILYSIRMRADADGRHISGCERIVTSEHVDTITGELIARAQGKNLAPDRIVVTIDRLPESPIRLLTSLDVVTVNAADMHAGRSIACRVLEKTGVSSRAAETAIRHLESGAASSGGNMRGAMIMDSETGERLERDRERGVRVSRFDWSDEALGMARGRLAAVGLSHHRTREALALATKVAHAPGVIAELCWSDDPDYTAGYVASLRVGYLRFPFLKHDGDAGGGRVFFIARDNMNLDELTHYLEEEAVLVSEMGECGPAVDADEWENHV